MTPAVCILRLIKMFTQYNYVALCILLYRNTLYRFHQDSVQLLKHNSLLIDFYASGLVIEVGQQPIQTPRGLFLLFSAFSFH